LLLVAVRDSLPGISAMNVSRQFRIFVFLLAAAPLFAQTNEPVASPVDQPPMMEAQRFFGEYARAAAFLEKGGRDQASLVMNQLYKTLRTTPWLEIALVKHSELVEETNENAAMDGYDLLRKRLANAPYFQANVQRSRLFGGALQSAVDRGISRVRLAHLRDGLRRYFARYMQYPESLAKLSIFNYVDAADIVDPNNKPFRYLPTGMQLRPTITYLRYELESIPAEPFIASSPKLVGTSKVNDDPEQYVCLIRVPGKAEPVRISEEQTIEGYYVAAIAPNGAIFVGGNRILVIPVRE
jgi:hypothetical protein